tara:strand:- start:141 stop:323 length:183 start_codon:yes stop_codon:yes gene_type:complete
MQKYRVIKTNVECLFDNLTIEEAEYALANLEDTGTTGCSIEKYVYLTSEGKRLGRDPDLH